MIEQILFYIGAGLFIILLIALIVLNICKARNKHLQNKKIKQEEKQQQQHEKALSTEVKIKNDVRYTEGDAIKKENGEINITYNKQDIILNLNKTYIVGSKNKILPGKYTLLSVAQDKSTFSLRVNGISSTFSHGCDMVFNNGDVVCPTSQNIILR